MKATRIMKNKVQFEWLIDRERTYLFMIQEENEALPPCAGASKQISENPEKRNRINVKSPANSNFIAIHKCAADVVIPVHHKAF